MKFSQAEIRQLGTWFLRRGQQIADSLLSSNVPLKNTANVFTLTQTISQAAGNAFLSIASAAGTIRGFAFYTGASLRWLVGANGTAEGGANAGSDLGFIRYNDAGVAVGFPLVILRSSGYSGFNTTTPHSQLHVAGALATAYVVKIAAYTITAADSFVACDATAGAFTITLPTASGIAGREYTVKKTDASVNAVTVDANGAQTIDGALTYALAAQFATVVVVSDGSNWLIKSKF